MEDFRPNLGFEILDGASVVLSLFYIVFTIMFVVRETRFLGIRYRDIFPKVPDSMNHAICVLLFNFGFCLHELLRWTWRRFYNTADLGVWQVGLFALSGALIVAGMLCKIRSVTDPFYGMRPWIMALVATSIFVVVSLVFR